MVSTSTSPAEGRIPTTKWKNLYGTASSLTGPCCGSMHERRSASATRALRRLPCERSGRRVSAGLRPRKRRRARSRSAQRVHTELVKPQQAIVLPQKSEEAFVVRRGHVE